MSPTELKMQDTIYLESKPGYFSRPYPGLLCKCIVGCIFNSIGFIITREIPCPVSISIIYNVNYSQYVQKTSKTLT
jgi:hypothetical protein